MSKVTESSLDSIRALRAEAAELAATYGSNAYTDFVLKHGRRPDRAQAAAMGRLIGGRVRASDGSLQPSRTKAERAASRDARLAQDADLRLDIELSRALDAIAFLAKNEIDPAPLIARLSTAESLSLNENIERAVLWLQRFANGWTSHVNIGNEEAKESSTGIGNQVERRGLRLIRSRDPVA